MSIEHTGNIANPYDDVVRARRLASAAPDMLEALRGLLGKASFALTSDGWQCNYCHREYSSHDEKPTSCIDDCPGEIARAAVAKATGEA